MVKSTTYETSHYEFLFTAGTHISWVLRRLATIFCTVAPNTCGASVPNLLHLTLLAPIIFGWIFNFFFGGGGYVRLC